MLEDAINSVMGRDEEEGTKKRRRKSSKEVITGKVDAVNFSTSLASSAKDSRLSQDDITNLLTRSREQAYLEWSYPGLFKDKDSEDPDKELIKCHVVFNDTFSKFKIYDVKVVTSEDDIVDDAYQISLEDAQEFKKGAKLGDIVEIPFDTTKLDKAYVRRVKQLYLSHLKDSSRQAILSVYKDQIGGLIYGTVISEESSNNSLGFDRRGEQRLCEVSFGKANGTLRNSGKGRNRLPGDIYSKGDRVCVLLSDVSDKSNPPSLVITRTTERFVEKLRAREVPELASGEITIKAIAREPGRRTKVLVDTSNKNIDPVGSCIGPENSRTRAISSELHGEKIDIQRWRENKALQIIEARKPATVIGRTCPDDFFDSNVHYEEIENDRGYIFPKITVVVRNGNQGIAIGKGGANVRLASKITKCSLSVLQADDAIKQGLKYRMIPEINEAIKKEFPDAVLSTPLPTAAVPTEEEGLSDEEIGLKPEQNEVVINGAKPTEEVKSEVKPAEEAKPEETAVKTEEVKAEAPVVQEEVKPAEEAVQPETVKEEPKEEEVVHVEIKNKPKISLEALEQAREKKKGPAETKSYKRYNDYKKKEGDDTKKKEEKETSSSLKGRAIYTDEELKNRDLEQQGNESEYSDSDYDEDVAEQYDSDKYYDDNK